MPVRVGTLENAFTNDAVVTPAALLSAGVISQKSGRVPRVKILGGGTITKRLNISGVEISASAKEAILKAGGNVTGK